MSPIAESYEPENETASLAVIETDVIFDDLPSHKDIAALAYSYWEARGCKGGSPEEKELRGKSQPEE